MLRSVPKVEPQKKLDTARVLNGNKKPEKLTLGPFPITPNPPSPVRERAASFSSVETKTKLQPMFPNVQARSRSIPRRLDDDDVLRVSFEDPTAVHHDNHDHMHRKSADSRRSTVHTMDTPHALYPPVTPLSMSSMRSEAAELSEAKAINFYPHTNNSLLLVQHGSNADQHPDISRLGPGARVVPETVVIEHPSNAVHHAIELTTGTQQTPSPSPPAQPVPPSTTIETEEILHLTPPDTAHSAHAPNMFSLGPQLQVEPSTPPHQAAAEAPEDIVDSPLRNPRKPPVPPAVKVIPATPFQERDAPLDEAGANLARPPPSRTISLVKKARRYSDSVIAPLIEFGRTGSLKGKRYISGGSERADGGRSKESSLHPFWRPRGFWDDFSDSDSDEFWGDGELVDPNDDIAYRLPEGGDTSDVRSLENERRVNRMNSVKKVVGGIVGRSNSITGGGFLIGNSLGVERAGTNKRRHIVRLPTRLQARFAQPQPSSGNATASAPPTSYGGSGDLAGIPMSREFQQSPRRPMPPSHVNDVYYRDTSLSHMSAASAPASSARSNVPAFSLSPPSGFAHNATDPLPQRSSSQSPAYSGNISLSSFPSSYTSTAGSRRGRIRKSWRRSVRFPFRVEYVGFRGLVEGMRERSAEKRREALRGRIGAPKAEE